MQETKRTYRLAGLLLTLLLVASIPLAAQDQGFDIISEGVVEPTAPARLDVVLFGNAGYSFLGAFWASAGVRANFTLDALALHASASAGTDGTQVQGGVTTELFGFGTSADVAYTLGNTPVISLRGWGDIANIGLTANATFAGTAISFLVGGNMNFETYGLSANLGFANGTFTNASVGANTTVGALSLSANGGWAAGQLTASGGAGLVLGPVQITANAGYNSGIGLNAVVSAGLGWPAFQMTAVAMLDNTGIGLESTAQLSLGNFLLSAVGRFGGNDISVEIGSNIPLGKLAMSISIAFDATSGLSWAEIGFEYPL